LAAGWLEASATVIAAPETEALQYLLPSAVNSLYLSKSWSCGRQRAENLWLAGII
jgi:hypothetical protein